MTPDDAIRLGVALVGHGDIDNAQTIFRRVLDAVPDHPDALNFLGVLTYRAGDAHTAVGMLKRAAEVAPDFAGIRNNLGILLLETGDTDGAAEAYRMALKLDPDAVDPASNLAAILKSRREYEEAEALLRRALDHDPKFGPAHHHLGDVLLRTGRTVEAIDHFWKATRYMPPDDYSPHMMALAFLWNGERDKAVAVVQEWLGRDPKSVEARHLLAGITSTDVPERAPDDYVELIFDRFANSFDAKLARLDYHAPQLVEAAVREVIGEPDGTLSVLDAGCGTGLCGPLIRPYAKRLEGVDLSAAMLDKAARRHAYDELAKDELTAFLGRGGARYDLIISADTLCYFGVLDAFAANAAQALRPGGVLIFTVEAQDDEAGEDFLLSFTGRYAHSARYVRAALATAEFSDIRLREGTLRMEYGRPVRGHVASARIA